MGTVWVCLVCGVWESHPEYGAALVTGEAHEQGTGHTVHLRHPQWTPAPPAAGAMAEVGGWVRGDELGD